MTSDTLALWAPAMAIIAGAIVWRGARSKTVSQVEQRAADAWESQARAYKEQVEKLQIDVKELQAQQLTLKTENRTLRDLVSGLPSVQQYTQMITVQHENLMQLMRDQHHIVVSQLKGTQ